MCVRVCVLEAIKGKNVYNSCASVKSSALKMYLRDLLSVNDCGEDNSDSVHLRHVTTVSEIYFCLLSCS